VFRTAYFTCDHPKTNIDVAFQYYPSLSDWGRQRLQLDAALKREVFRDFYLGHDFPVQRGRRNARRHEGCTSSADTACRRYHGPDRQQNVR
jgi:hypothetical protein